MLSVLYGIQTDSIVNYSITKNFNERDAIHFLIKDLNKNSIVILDRGYYFIKKNLFVSNQIHCIMRLKKDANKIIKTFYDSINIYYETKFIKMRLIKYKINKIKYIIGTSIMNK